MTASSAQKPMALKSKTNVNHLRTPNSNAKSHNGAHSIKKPTSVKKKSFQTRDHKYVMPRSPPPKKLTVFSDSKRKPITTVLGASLASPTPATSTSASRLGLKRPKMLVFKETAQVLDQAAALVNAKVNELRDKENIPPPDLLENNEKPLETPKKRYIAPKGVERKPLSILLDEDTDDENSVQEDNNDGHFVVLQSSLAPSPGKQLSDEEELEEPEEITESTTPFRTPTRATPKKKQPGSVRKPRPEGSTSAKKKKTAKLRSPLADTSQKSLKKKKKGISLIR